MSELSGIDLSRRSRQTMILPGRQRGERRAKLRIAPVGNCTATFSINGEPFTATVRNISAAGAAFVYSPGVGDSAPTPGSVLELQIRTSWECVERKGRVVWFGVVQGEHQFGVEYVELPRDADCVGLLNLDRVKIDPRVALKVSASLAVRRQVLPFALAEGKVHVACVNPTDTAALQAIEKMIGSPVQVEPAEPESLKRALDRVYGDLSNAAAPVRPRSVDLRSTSELAPEDIVALCEELLQAALLRQASDIHIDPEVDGVLVRFRVDGVLERYRKLPPTVTNGLLSRFKVMCGMDIAEKRAPQDGGFKHSFGRSGQVIDLRVATLPTKHGERMTLRLLALQTESLTLERLGMREQDLRCFAQAIDKPHGMILLTGPTGSGKTTTLYAAMRRLLDHEDLNVVTVEDPIEYEMKGVAQVEIDSADKVSFVKALRSVLRHDPDVVMIGEIRDQDTADVAIKASLTGHLVFSTLHTNSAVSVITRLADMGVDRFLIAATLRLAVAQRLVRQLCPRCRQPRDLTAAEATALHRPDLAGRLVYDPKGCIYCSGRGYTGRLGIFEMLLLDEEWSRSIALGAEEGELLGRMREANVATLIDDGVEKLLGGVTSVREVLNAASIW
jgi:type IV pilus assembly protein PilB